MTPGRLGLLPVLLLAAGSGCAPSEEDSAVPAPQVPVAAPPLSSASAPAPIAKGPLTLEDCTSMALSNSRRVGVADRRVLIAKDRLEEDLSSVLPKLTAEGRYDWRDNDRGTKLATGSFVAGEREATSLRLGLVVPIYDFGRSSWHREADRFQIDAARHDAGQARQQAAFAVSQAYFRFLEAQKIRGVVEESIRVLERQLGVSRDFLKQGLVARSDVLTAEVQMAERRQDLVRSLNNVELARAALNRLLGLDVESPTEVVDVLEACPWSGSFGPLLATARERRPDVAALRARLQAIQADYRSVSKGDLPSLFATAGYNRSSDDTLLNRDWSDAALVFQVPLFDGFGTRHRKARMGKEAEEAKDLLEDRLDDVALEVKQACLLISETVEQVPVAQKGVELGTENLRVIRDQYGEGLVTSADVLAEEDRLSRARTSYFRALYDSHVAYARLVNVIAGPPAGR